MAEISLPSRIFLDFLVKDGISTTDTTRISGFNLNPRIRGNKFELIVPYIMSVQDVSTIISM